MFQQHFCSCNNCLADVASTVYVMLEILNLEPKNMQVIICSIMKT